MFDPPQTLEDANKRSYGLNYSKRRFDPKCCAYEPWSGGRGSQPYQCTRKPGHGPSSLYCKQHAEIVAPTKPPKPAKKTFVGLLIDENEALKRRVRELEAAVREHREKTVSITTTNEDRVKINCKLWSVLDGKEGEESTK